MAARTMVRRCVDAAMLPAMTQYDAYNGDADGLCSLHQLRLEYPPDSVLVTGVKRDIALLDRVPAQPGDSVTVLDVSVASNRATLTARSRLGGKADARAAGYADAQSAARNADGTWTITRSGGQQFTVDPDRTVMRGENTPNNIFVDIYAESPSRSVVQCVVSCRGVPNYPNMYTSFRLLQGDHL